MQTQIKIPDGHNGADKNNADDDHQDVGVTRCGDEARQIMRGGWMKGLAHATPHSENASDVPSGDLGRHSAAPTAASLHNAGTWQAQARARMQRIKSRSTR